MTNYNTNESWGPNLGEKAVETKMVETRDGSSLDAVGVSTAGPLSTEESVISLASQPNMKEAALGYARRDWRVFPLHTPDPAKGTCSCDNAECAHPGKHPRWDAELLPNGHKNATCDPTVIEQWWAKWPNANIGIRTGEESGLVVLDVDGPAAEEALRDYLPLPPTPTATTGKGKHSYFRKPAGSFNKVIRVLPDVDCLADKGSVIAPPSLHVSGKRYEWQIPLDEMEIAETPQWLCDLVKSTKEGAGQVHGSQSNDPENEGERLDGFNNTNRGLQNSASQQAYAEKALDGELCKVRRAVSGTRNDTTFKASAALGSLIPAGELNEARVYSSLLDAATSTGLSTEEARKTIRNGLEEGKKQPRRIPPPRVQSGTSSGGKQNSASTGEAKPKYRLSAYPADELMEMDIPETNALSKGYYTSG